MGLDDGGVALFVELLGPLPLEVHFGMVPPQHRAQLLYRYLMRCRVRPLSVLPRAHQHLRHTVKRHHRLHQVVVINDGLLQDLVAGVLAAVDEEAHRKPEGEEDAEPDCQRQHRRSHLAVLKHERWQGDAHRVRLRPVRVPILRVILACSLISQCGVRLRNKLRKILRSFRIGILVRMVFERQLAVSLLDGWHFRASVEAHDLIRIEGLVLLGKRLDVENYNTHEKPTKYQQ
mmetsp:Transcript_8539/g.14711  ORF Transcript_8539/g.14711 Transcript_8539/m.14711 type:complete len:232 (-) Transcript_8539:349-1044(-)